MTVLRSREVREKKPLFYNKITEHLEMQEPSCCVTPVVLGLTSDPKTSQLGWDSHSFQQNRMDRDHFTWWGGLAHLGLVISSSLLTTHQAYNKSKKISHRSSESVSFLSQASMLFLHGSLRNCLSRHLRVFVSSQKFEACLSQSPQFWLMVDKGNSSSMASFEHQRKEPTSCSHAEGKLSWGVEVEIQVSCNGWCISLSNPGMKSRDFAGTCKSNVANGWAQPLVPHERPLYLCYFQTVLDSTRGFHVGEDVMVFLTSMSTFLTSTSTFFSCWEWRWHQVHELQMCSRCWLQLDFCTQQFKMAFMRSSVLFIDTSINQSRTLFSVTLWTANV